MQYSIDKSIEILERTPAVLMTQLSGLSDNWTQCNEGADTWSAFDIVGHLIHGDRTDWLPRAELILSGSPERKFAPFDRFAQFEESKGKSLPQLLAEFKELRYVNIQKLIQLNISENDLSKTGIHPAFGEVTLSQLLSCWVVHDLNHLAQVSRVMAKQYKEEVGPWIEYLRVLK
ncbi:DinB family protein [Flavitalea antarctica]